MVSNSHQYVCVLWANLNSILYNHIYKSTVIHYTLNRISHTLLHVIVWMYHFTTFFSVTMIFLFSVTLYLLIWFKRINVYFQWKEPLFHFGPAEIYFSITLVNFCYCEKLYAAGSQFSIIKVENKIILHISDTNHTCHHQYWWSIYHVSFIALLMFHPS